MNPYQHSDVAAAIYQDLVDLSCMQQIEQSDLGDISCKLAEMLSRKFDLELQPVEAVP